MIQNQKFTRVLWCALALLTALCGFCAPTACKTALTQGLELCGGTLLFALFPFFIVSSLLVRSGTAALLGAPLRGVCHVLGLRAPCASGILLLALLGGFAPAVSAIRESVDGGALSAQEASRLLPTCCVLGPSFIILGIGEGLLDSLATGVLLFASQILACFSVGLALRVWGWCARGKRTPERQCAREHAKEANAAQSFTLTGVIGDAAFSFMRLCAVVLYLRFLAAGLTAFLPPEQRWLPTALLEVTTGCALIAARGVHASVLCCAALSVLSLSILLQIAALCPRGVSLAPLLATRALHAPCALGFFWLLLRLLPPTPAYNSLSERVLTFQRLHTDQAILVFIVCICTAWLLQKSLHARQDAL